MSKKKILAILTGTATVATAIAAYEAKKKADKTTYEANLIEPIKKRKRGIYEKYIKRALDVICATGAIVVFSPVYLGVAVLVKLKLGSPVLFTQDRPGLIGKDGRETVFKMYKFRTMTDERDENGELLPDEARLTKFGKWLRNTSLDELPEAFNILNGTMSVIGPRPQLVRDISYIHSEAYAAGELKHGTISLIEPGTLVIGVLTQSKLYEKTMSNMVECRSRGAYLLGLTTYGKYEIEETVDFAVYVPRIDEYFAGSLAVVPLQLLGYYVSVAKGLDVDKPRNLAKSVTVE